MMTLESRLRPRVKDVAAQVMDGEAILINLGTGMYYSLGGAGAAAWALIEGEHTLGEISQALCAQFVAPDPETVEADVVRLANDLLQEELVEVSDREAPAPAGSPPEEKLPYTPVSLQSYSDMQDLLALDPPMPGVDDAGWETEPDEAAD
jgi:hypothetical protein